MTSLTPSAKGEHKSYWRRHVGALFLGGFGLLLLVIVVGQLLDRGDVEAWLAEQSAAVAYLIVFLLVGLDAVVPIFPGETTLNAASTIAADGGLELELIMLAGALGAIVGDSCLFWIARRNAAKVRPSLDKAKKNQKVEAAWSMLDASPGLLIVGGRYVPGMRFAVNASMGLSDIPYRRFLPWSVSEARCGRSTRAVWRIWSRRRLPASRSYPWSSPPSSPRASSWPPTSSTDAERGAWPRPPRLHPGDRGQEVMTGRPAPSTLRDRYVRGPTARQTIREEM